MDTYDKVVEILVNSYDVDPEAISPRSTFESLQLDSLDTIEIITEIEDEFDIALEDLEELSDFESLIDKIDELQAAE